MTADPTGPTSSELLWPWALGLALLAVVGVGVLAWRTRPARPASTRWVAHTGHLDDVPGIRRAVTTYRVLRGAGAAAVVLALLGAGVLAARPVDRTEQTQRLGTRDIVLCLDVSGSMIPFDARIIDSFIELVQGFSGERIALSVFNSTSRTVFPLTDDYTLVLEELAAAQEGLDFDVERFDPDDPLTWDRLEEFLAFTSGTIGVPGEGSLIGDGLASCGLLFDEQATDRSRSILLATDNDVFGDPIYTLPQAVDLVVERDVEIYGLYGGDETLRGSEQDVEFDEAITDAGGTTWYAEDPAAVDEIVTDVTAQQAVVLDDDAQVVVSDRPQPWFALVLTGLLALLAVRWVVRE